MNCMKLLRHLESPVVLVLLGLFLLYLAGYGIYRFSGPVALVWPRGDDIGRDNDYPSLMISLESPHRALLYRIYQPCITLENGYHYLRHHGN